MNEFVYFLTFSLVRRIMYTGCGKKYTTKNFFSFLSNRLEFQSEILPTYLVILYAHNSIMSI